MPGVEISLIVNHEGPGIREVPVGGDQHVVRDRAIQRQFRERGIGAVGREQHVVGADGEIGDRDLGRERSIGLRVEPHDGQVADPHVDELDSVGGTHEDRRGVLRGGRRGLGQIPAVEPHRERRVVGRGSLGRVRIRIGKAARTEGDGERQRQERGPHGAGP